MEHVRPPLDGSLATILHFVDFHARHNPDRPWLLLSPVGSSEELRSVSFGDMAEASHRIASAFRPGRGPDGQIVALLLNVDNAIYVPTLLGVMRAGCIPFPMSPRNSVQGVLFMLESTKCTRVLYDVSCLPLAHKVQSEMASKGVELELNDIAVLSPIFSELMSGSHSISTSHVTYPPSQHKLDLDEPMLYVHSSGSTGLPKSVPFRHSHTLQNFRKTIFGAHKKPLVMLGSFPLPTFHTMGLMSQIFYPLSSGGPVAVFSPQYPAPPVVPSPRVIHEAARAAQCDALIAPPSIIEAWSHSQEIVDYLKTLKVLVFGGGPLSRAVGDKLVAAGVPLISGYGASEFGSPTKPWDEVPEGQLLYNPDWAWLRISDNVKAEFVPQGDGTFELVLHETDQFLVRVYNVPGQRSYATSDLFEPHPTKAGLWRLVGRKDDVIVLSTGEKVVPIPQEGRISASPLVAGCVMFGREQEQAGVLVETAPDQTFDPSDTKALAEFRNKLWPTVEAANAEAPAFAKIFKEMIMVADPTKPFPRSAKNSIMRKMALSLYPDEIESLYATVKESSVASGVAPPDSWSIRTLQPWLQALAGSVLSRDTVDPEINLFYQGFDSLSATFLRNRIIGALRCSTDPAPREAAKNISSNFVFDHPTVNDIARVLSELCTSGSTAVSSRTRAEEIRAMVAKYTADLPTPRASAANTLPGAPVVLLTGSTGNIGSHILAHILADDRIGRVYTINRPSEDPLGRLRAALTERELPVDLLDTPKVVCLAGDVCREYFGLEVRVYDEILSSVTHIIHNAWTVNFNLPLQAFEDQLVGVRKLIDVRASAEHPIKLLVTSSIGITNGWPASNGPIPERPLPEQDDKVTTGYAASKSVIEQILEAARATGLQAMAVRMGQACGPKTTGAWGTTEWFPMLVKSSLALGCFPIMSGSVAWVPLDAIGDTYTDWVTSCDELPALVNVVHPRPVSWEVVLGGVREELGGNLPFIPLAEWVAELEARSEKSSLEDLSNIPALKILDFFRGLARSGDPTLRVIHEDGVAAADKTFETTQFRRSSPAMNAIRSLDEEHGRMWVRFWRRKAYIK